MTTVTGETVNVKEKSQVKNTAAIVNEPFNLPPTPLETRVLMDTPSPESTQVDLINTDNVGERETKTISKLSKIGGATTKDIISETLCGSTLTIVVLVIFAIIPILQLYIGWRYANQCPVSPRIPHYLVVAGVFGLVTIVLVLVQSILTIFVAKKMLNESSASQKVGLVGACGICSLSVAFFFLTVFLIGWFIAGCFWVFGVWNNVQYTHPNETSYCHPTLYRFAFWLLLISILYHLFSCIRSCFQARQQRSFQANNVTGVQIAEL